MGLLAARRHAATRSARLAVIASLRATGPPHVFRHAGELAFGYLATEPIQGIAPRGDERARRVPIFTGAGGNGFWGRAMSCHPTWATGRLVAVGHSRLPLAALIPGIGRWAAGWLGKGARGKKCCSDYCHSP